ncbi:hypothetical protein RF11_05472 [Thelohanellus kitauei]|uniref:Uncharacterized protein n=1 Tax=Thelohanellus kitauei TaxID=669202 RepID=A0A0C2J6C2_THEKT|nr:hypothetical protein RF11_05472 [Thelohanellus kitauei]
MTDFFNSGKCIVNQEILHDVEPTTGQPDSEVVRQIKELLEEKKTAVISFSMFEISYFKSFDENLGLLKLKLQVLADCILGIMLELSEQFKYVENGHREHDENVEEVTEEGLEESDKIFKELEKRLKRIKNIDEIKE